MFGKNKGNIFSSISNSANKITINGVSYTGSSVTIDGKGNIIVDGDNVCESTDKVLNISIEGDVNKLTTASGSVNVNGDVDDINTTSGKVTVSGSVKDSIETVSGKVECGNIGGDVETVSGSVTAKGGISGDVETVSGRITR